MKRLLIALCAASALLSTGAAVALAGGSTGGGQIHVYGVNTGASTTNQIIITGAFAARGETSQVSTSIGMVTTPQGTFKVNLADLQKAPGTGRINEKTCSGAFKSSAPITLFDGTGAYKGIRGTIKLTTTFAAILPTTTSGKCRRDANPITNLSFFEGEGTVSF
jgi:hypothetical protein